LLIQNSTITGNTGNNSGGGIFLAYAATAIEIENSTFSNNHTTYVGSIGGYIGGGAISLSGTPSGSPPAGFTPGAVVIKNSTIANNDSTGTGGGIQSNGFYGALIIQDSTISGNSCAATGSSGSYALRSAAVGSVFRTWLRPRSGHFDSPKQCRVGEYEHGW